MSQAPAHAGDGHEHPPHLQHHFESSEQQFDAGKLGIWLFLATEVLLFGGLFVAYSIYRASHPEIFLYAHQYLDRVLGGTNTVILLCSSLTMAWAVRAAQLGQRKLQIVLLALTLCGGFGFLGIKYVEYKAKWEHGLLPGTHFAPHDAGHGEGGGATPPAAAGAPTGAPAAGPAAPSTGAAPGAVPSASPAAAQAPAAAPPTASATGGALPIEMSRIAPAAAGPGGTVPAWEAAQVSESGAHIGKRPSNVQIFFGIYFLMTGLHGLHVIIGMGAIAWILIRSLRGEFGPEYFTPVDFVGLYWHLVDLIWIFLFPLLYLIG